MKSQSNHHPIGGRIVVSTSVNLLAAMLLIVLSSNSSRVFGQAKAVAIADSHADQAHLFRFVPSNADHVKQVFLAGDFNGWSTNATAMIRSGDAFQISVPLADGVHYYKFVVDGHWTNDPQSQPELEVSDDNGGRNSAVMIGLDARKLPSPANDRINASAIAFDQADTRDFNVASSTLLRVSIRAQADDVFNISLMVQSRSDGRNSHFQNAKRTWGLIALVL